jgi:hypothetical protein
MSNSNQTLLQEMNQKSVALGWDVVVAYNAQSVNELFAAQYVVNLKDNADSMRITETLDVGSGLQLQLTDLTLGPPLISFPTTPGSQVALVTMNFISGSIVVLQQIGPAQVAVGYQTIAPGNGFLVQMTVPLAQVAGSVTGHQRVILKLTDAAEFVVTLGPAAAAGYLAQYFEQIFQAGRAGAFTYDLGTMVTNNPGTLTPVSFDICTLPKPGTNGQDGAVLLLVAVHTGTTGTKPGADYPYIIPDGSSAALIVASKTFFQDILQPYFALNINGSPTFQVNQFSVSSPASYLTFTGGRVDAGVIAHSWVSGLYEYSVWSGHRHTTSHAYIPFLGLSVQPENHLLSMQWSNQGSFHQSFGTSQSGAKLPYLSSTNVNLTVSAVYTASATVDPETQVVSLAENGQPQIEVKFGSSSWVSKWFGGNAKDAAGLQMAKATTDVIQDVFCLPLPSVSVFAASHLLFPESNYLQYASASIPGDLAVFGQVELSETSFSISPLQSVMPTKRTLQLTVSNASTPTWTVFPEIGSISSDGVYSSPEESAKTFSVIITATEGTNTASAVITVLPTPYSVVPAGIMIFPGGGPQQFEAAATDVSGSLVWELFPSDGSAGALDANGLYTPPATFPSGMSSARVQVTAPGSARDGSATIALCNETPTVNVDPPFAFVPGEGSQPFSVPGQDTATITWNVHPEFVYGYFEGNVFSASNRSGAILVVTATTASGAKGFALVMIT